MSAVMNKRCPKCNLTDMTDFSKCRNCGAKYERKTEASTAPGSPPSFFWVIAGGLLVALFAFQTPIINAVEKMSGSTLSANAH